MLTQTYKFDYYAIQYSKLSDYIETCKIVDKNEEFDKQKEAISKQLNKNLKVIYSNLNTSLPSLPSLPSLSL